MVQTANKKDIPPNPSTMGWGLLSSLGFAQICSWGTLYYAFPQISVAMIGEFGWEKSEVYGALTIGLLLSAFAAIPVGAAIDKGYGRIVMSGGSIIAGILFLLWSQTQSLVWFYIIFAGIGFLQAAVLYSAVFAVVAKYYSSTYTRDYITTLTLWGGFASTLFIPLIEILMNYISWREVLIVLGTVNIIICGGIYQLIPNHRTSTKDENASNFNRSKVNPSQSKGVKWALMQPIFWTLLICFAIYSAMASSFRFHLYPLLIENGLDGEDAVFILALLGPAQVAGRALMKIFKDKSIAYIGIFIASLFPLSFISMIVFPVQFYVLVGAGIAYGAAAGTMTIVKGVAVSEFLTKNSYGLINGLMNTPIMILKAFGPAIVAVAWSFTGNYEALMYGLLIASIIMLLSFMMAAFISKNKTIQEKTV